MHAHDDAAWQLTHALETDQGMVRWAAWGDSASPAMVLTHGTPFSSYVWRHVAPALARNFRVFVWDLAGYGRSDMFEGQDVTLAAQARILIELVNHWQVEQPILVGHDFGGAIALRAHLLHELSCRRLVLIDAVAVAPWGTGFFQLAKQHADVLLQLPGPVHDGLVRGYVTWPTSTRLAPADVAALVEPWATPEGRRALYRQIAQNDQRFTDELEPLYPTIDVPTLIVWGAQDAWLPVEQAHQLAAAIPNSAVEVIDGANHLVPLEAAASVATLITTFSQP